MPRPLSATQTISSPSAIFCFGRVTRTIGVSDGSRLVSAMNSSKALSISSATHCQGWYGISPRISSSLGDGVRSSCSSDSSFAPDDMSHSRCRPSRRPRRTAAGLRQVNTTGPTKYGLDGNRSAI